MQKSHDHPSHTGDPANCRLPDSRKFGKRKTAGPHRDPAIPARGEAELRNPQDRETDLDRDPVGGGDLDAAREEIEEEGADLSAPSSSRDAQAKQQAGTL